MCVLSHFSRVWLCDLVDCSPPGSSMGFSRQEDWGGLPCPPPGGLPDSGIEPVTLASSALIGVFFMTSANWEVLEWSMLLLLLSHFSRVWLCVTPWTAAHQVPLSTGFSRQEHWSGLPLPSPMRESEKWKWSRSVVSNSQRHHGLQPTRLLRPWDFPGKSTGVGFQCLLPEWIMLNPRKKTI